MKKILLTTLIVLAIMKINAQPGVNPYTARIIIKKGSHVDFIFDSYNKYKNGILLNDWTTIAIAYKNPDDPTDTWRLTAEANTPEIMAESGFVNLPLDIIRLLPADIGTKAPTLVASSPLILREIGFSTLAGIQLIGGGQQGNEKENVISISYDCGVLNKIPGNAPSEMYGVDIILTLSSDK